MATVDIEWRGIDNLSGVADGVGGALSGLAGIAKGALSVAFGNILTGAVNSAGKAIGEFWTGALDAEKGLAKFRNTLRLAGETAGLTEDAALDLAEKFKNLAGGSDDAVIAIQEMGLRMGITGGEMEGFIQSTLDLAAVTGNAESAAALIALAQEDVAAAMTKARRAGILLTDEQKDQIKAMDEAGDKAGAAALFMDILASKTEGMAESMAGPTGAKLDSFKERLADIGENAVTAFLPMITTAFDAVAPLVEGAAEQLGAFAETVASAIASGNIASLFPPEVLAQIQPIIDAVTNLGAAFQEQMPAMQAEGQKFIAWAKEAFGPTLQTTLDNVTVTLNGLAEFWREWGDEIMTVVGVAFQFIAVTIGGTLTLISGLIAATMQAVNGDWEGAWQTIMDTLETFMNLALSIVGTNLDEFVGVWRTNWEMLQAIVSELTMQITSGIQTWLIDLINALRDKLGDALQFGIDFANNIILGVLQMAGQIAQVAYDVVAGAVKAAASALGGAAAAVTGGAPAGGFQHGGFTGVGPSREIAGVVHRNEWVVPEGGALVLRGGGNGGLTNYGTINVTLQGDESTLDGFLRSLQSLPGGAAA